jgi:thioredoxin 1
LATDNAENAKVGKIDVTENMELAVKYQISAVPTIILFKGGEEVERLRGYKDKDELQKVIDAHTTA